MPKTLSADTKQQALRKRFTPAEWDWLQADENCRNVLERADFFNALFYLRYRVPRKLRAARFWQD